MVGDPIVQAWQPSHGGACQLDQYFVPWWRRLARVNVSTPNNMDIGRSRARHKLPLINRMERFLPVIEGRGGKTDIRMEAMEIKIYMVMALIGAIVASSHVTNWSKEPTSKR